jgi:hypothetical protein
MIPPLVSEASSSIKLSANLGGKRSESDERDGIFCGTHGMELGIGLPPEPNGPVPHQAGVLFFTPTRAPRQTLWRILFVLLYYRSSSFSVCLEYLGKLSALALRILSGAVIRASQSLFGLRVGEILPDWEGD